MSDNPSPAHAPEAAAPAPAPAAPAPAAPAPEPEYVPFTREDLRIPEGMALDDAMTDRFLSVINADGEPGEIVNNLLGLHNEVITSFTQKLEADAIAAQEAAAKQLREDPEIGGKNLPASEAAFARVLGEFGTPELASAIERSGLGNSIPFAKFLVGLDKIISEGKPTVGGPTSEPNLAQRLYPNQGKI